MEVIIQEVVGTVRAMDGTALLDSRTMGQIVRAVMAAMDSVREQDRRREADTKTHASRGPGA